MYQKWIIFLTAVLVIVGCNNSSGVKEELVNVPVSLGAVDDIVTDADGLTKDLRIDILGTNTDGDTVITSTLTISKGQKLRDAQGQATCTADNPCNISAEQKSEDANEVSACNESEWKRLIYNSIPDVPTDHVVLYSGTIDISEEDGVLTNCGMTVTINVPETALWLDSPRSTKRHGVGCSLMKVWVTSACNSTEGEWVDATIVQACSNGAKTITINVDKLPSHIVMFVTMDKNHPNITYTGGSI